MTGKNKILSTLLIYFLLLAMAFIIYPKINTENDFDEINNITINNLKKTAMPDRVKRYEKTTPEIRAGRLTIYTNIKGAILAIDGRQAGILPVQDKSMRAGDYQITIMAEGYRIYKKAVTLNSGQLLTLDVLLEKEEPVDGRLSVNASPSDAVIKILNIRLKYADGIALSPGQYHVQVSKKGYLTFAKWVSLSAGEDKSISVNLKKNNDVNHMLLKDIVHNKKRTIEIYKGEVSAKLKNNWVFSKQLAGETKGLESRLVIKILSDGSIKDIWFEKRSGNAYLDSSAYKTVMKSNPMPPLPEGFTDYHFLLGFTPAGLN